MALITKGGTLPDTGVTKNEVYALVDNATVSAIVNADIASNAAIAGSKLGSLSSITAGAGLIPSANLPPTNNITDAILRGFELVYGSTTTVKVNPGTLYNGSTIVATTAQTTLTISTATDYIGGSSKRGTSKWLYVYVKKDGAIKLYDSAPDYNDDAGTQVVAPYWYYKSGSDYYRCIGAIRLNATGSGEVTNFIQTGDMVQLDLPVTITTADPGANTWSGALSCAAAMPAISQLGYYYLYATGGANTYGVALRPHGSTWSDLLQYGGSGYGTWSSQTMCITDSSQQINVFRPNGSGFTSLEVSQYAYKLNIR